MTSSASSGNQAAIHSGRSKKANAGRPARRMAPRRTRPLALMKLTSSRIRPGAATPAVTGESLATRARLSATARRQKACRVRFVEEGGEISITAGGDYWITADRMRDRDIPTAAAAQPTARPAGHRVAASVHVTSTDESTHFGFALPRGDAAVLISAPPLGGSWRRLPPTTSPSLEGSSLVSAQARAARQALRAARFIRQCPLMARRGRHQDEGNISSSEGSPVRDRRPMKTPSWHRGPRE